MVRVSCLRANWRHLQPLDQLSPRPLRGPQRANSPFFSPDGQWIGFFADGKLKKIPVGGGEPVTLCDVDDVIGANWREDGTIVFGSIAFWSPAGLRGGRRADAAPRAGGGKGRARLPQAPKLPGGEALLVTRHDKNGNFGIEVLTLATRERKRLLENAFSARFAPTGHLVYGRGNSIFAAPFDVRRLEISGPSVLVVENVNGSPK